MTLVPIKCPHCGRDVSIIIEVDETLYYECFKCGGKFTAITRIKIVKVGEDI